LAKSHRITTYRFGSEVREVRDLAFEPSDDRTWIGTALAEVVARADAGALEHVVLISDGQSNGGRDPQSVVRAMDRKGIRLHAVWAGKPADSTAAVNVSARAARGPEEVLVGKVFEVSADFLALGGQGQELVVDFSIDGRPVST